MAGAERLLQQSLGLNLKQVKNLVLTYMIKE